MEALSRQVQVWRIARDGQGRLKLAAVLKKLGEESVTHLLIEAGGTLSESFLHQKLVHRIHFYYAPKIIGGKGAPSGVGGEGVKHLAEAVKAAGAERRLGMTFCWRPMSAIRALRMGISSIKGFARLREEMRGSAGR